MTNTDLLNSADSAALVGVHRQTFNKWVKSGRIKPVIVMPGLTGARLFDREDVVRLIADRDDPAA